MKRKIIKIQIYSYSETNIELENFKNSSNNSEAFNSLLKNYNSLEQKDLSNFDVKTTLSAVWTIASSAGEIKPKNKLVYENLKIFYTQPNETTDSLLIFNDLMIEFKKYGKYQLIFIVDGIESPLSGVVEINENMEVAERKEAI